MSDAVENTQDRRAVDQLLKQILDNQVEMMGVLKSLARAFPNDEFGEPDYDGHRRYHALLIRRNQESSQVRQEAVKRVVSAGALGLATVIAYAVWDYLRAALR